MNQVPDIVIQKIYWYIWHSLQRELCREYHSKFEYGWALYRRENGTVIVNYRFTYSIIYNFIQKRYTPYKLPKTYFYSNGIVDCKCKCSNCSNCLNMYR